MASTRIGPNVGPPWPFLPTAGFNHQVLSGCFGQSMDAPWFTMVFDLSAVAALLGLCPTEASKQTFPAASG